VAFCPDGRVLIGTDAGTIIFDDLSSGQRQEFHLNHPGLSAARFSPSGASLALAFADQPVVWDARTQAETRLGAAEPAQSVAFSPDGRTLLSGHPAGEVRVWDALSWEPTGTLSPGIGAITSLAVSADNRTVAISGAAGTVAVWDVLDRREVRKLTGAFAVFGPGGKTLAVAAANSAGIYDPLFWQRTIDLPHPQRVTQMLFAGGELVTGCADGIVRVWDLSTRQTRATFNGLGAGVDSMAISADGRTVAALGGGKLRVWDLLTTADRTPVLP
jgi:WD40 repeat protein